MLHLGGIVSAQPSERPTSQANGPEVSWTRNHLLLAVFFVGTALLLFCCYLLTKPFLPAIAWALALAVVAHPVHRWMKARVNSSIAAAVSVLLVALIVVAPMSLVAHALITQINGTLKNIESGELEQRLQSILSQNPRLMKLWQRVTPEGPVKDSTEQLTTVAGKWTGKLLGGSIAGSLSVLIAFFLLFYLLRDRETAIGFVRSVLPLSNREANEVFARVRDTIFASVYGTLSVAAVQGTLGGLMFWWLGLPAPLLWGVVMGLLAIIPVLGAFVIWIPAAIFLAAQGAWGKAILLAVWGLVIIGLIDNLLYPVIVGKRLRLHTVPVFIAIVGGLAVFGASGIILGPLILALTDAAIEVWRCRTARNHSAVDPVS